MFPSLLSPASSHPATSHHQAAEYSATATAVLARNFPLGLGADTLTSQVGTESVQQDTMSQQTGDILLVPPGNESALGEILSPAGTAPSDQWDTLSDQRGTESPQADTMSPEQDTPSL